MADKRPSIRLAAAGAAIGVTLGWAAGARAAPDEPAPDAAGREPACAADEGWEVSVAPYIWFAGLNGDLGTPGRLPDVSVDTAFSDILDALKFGAMAMGAARRDRLVIVGDLSYAELEASKDLKIRDPGLVTGEATVRQFMSTLAGGYRAVDRGATFVDLLAGIRIVAIDQEVQLSGPGRTVSGGSSKTLTDPIVGVRLGGPIADRWAYDLYGDVGGFGVSSSLTWQLMGVVNYRLSPHWTAAGGWRHLAIDTSNSGFKFDAGMDGPILGFAYRF
ncbi:hypothetical protein [Phenylobacterium sp. J367]|uniref:hypothetical protein n=1 Tax=Phenylobacterium sp. J367 TaxID=2898435 RepID=UPI0021516CDE|nr:hypothetical protein [Phenylobacterium sp. J367]MCR5878879.1 hypothetical protein [Phenylobacterium sp. J367]